MIGFFLFKEFCQTEDCRSGDCELLRLSNGSIKRNCHCAKVNFFIFFFFSIDRICSKGVCGETCQRLCNTTSPCDTNPCWFDGTCVDVSSFDYICLCPANHSGKDCRIFLSCQSNTCHHGGTCFQSGL